MADGFLRSAVSPGWNPDRAVGLCAVQGSRLARGVRGARGHEDRARDAGRWRLGKAGAGRSTLTPFDRGGISGAYLVSRVRSLGGFHRHGQLSWLAMVSSSSNDQPCQPKSATGMLSPKRWKLLGPHQARCMSAPKHWQQESSTQCPPASLKPCKAFQL